MQPFVHAITDSGSADSELLQSVPTRMSPQEVQKTALP